MWAKKYFGETRVKEYFCVKWLEYEKSNVNNMRSVVLYLL